MARFTRDKKKMVLALLICVFAVSLIYRVTHLYRQPRVDTLTFSGAESKGEAGDVPGKDLMTTDSEEALVKLDMFLYPPAHSRDMKRDLFFLTKEVPETVLKSQYEPARTAEDIASPGDGETGVAADLSGFRSFGYMEQGEDRILFLEKGKQIYLIKKGDRIEEKYLVQDITKNELTLTVISDNEVVHIDLGDLQN